MPPLALADEDLGEFAALIPTEDDDDLGEFSGLIPKPAPATLDAVQGVAPAPEDDLGEFAALLPQSPAPAAAQAASETPAAIALDALRNVPAGAGVGAVNAASGLLKIADDVTGFAGKPVPGGIYELATGWLKQRAKDIPAEQGVNPTLAGGLPAKIGQGVGSFIPTLASGGAAPVVVAGMMGEQGRQDAERSGATEEQKDRAFYTNAAVGAVSERLLGVPALLKSAKAVGVTDDVYRSLASRAAEQAVKSSAREATQEGIQKTAENLIASTIAGYDPSRGTFKDVPESMLIGGIVGGPMGAAVQASVSPVGEMAIPNTPEPNGSVDPASAVDTESSVEGSTARMPSSEANAAAPPAPEPNETVSETPSYEQRRFGVRFQADENVSQDIRDQTQNREYQPIPNVATVAEAEAIVDERGTDESVRLVKDEAFPMEPRVRSVMAQGLIRRLNKSYEEAKAANDPRADEFLNQAVDTAEYLSELGTRLGQGVQSFAVWSRLTPEGMAAGARRTAKRAGVELTPEQTADIDRLTGEIDAAPEGFQKDEKTINLMDYMANLKGADPSEIPTSIYYANILSGYSTQLVNTIDTGLNVLSEAAAMAVSHPTSIPQIMSGLYQGMIKGGFEAAGVLRDGRGPVRDKIAPSRILERTTFGKEGGVPINTETRLGRYMKAALESKVAAPLNLWKYPLRAMVASDTVMYSSMKEARARVLARVIGKKEGLSGDALFQRIEQILNNSPESRTEALKQAESEGLSGALAQRRAAEIAEQGRPEELVSSANEAAEIATYNHDPSGVMGLVASNIQRITEGFPPGKAVIPFTRIVANVTNRGLNYTPWGYKRLFFGQWGGKGFSTEPPQGEGYRTQVAKATLGTTAMATVAVLDAAGTIQISANGPEDPDERRQLQNAGWKPYSVKIGDTYYSYQYTPMNLGFAMVGHYRDGIRYNKLSEKDAQSRLAYAAMKSMSTITDMSFLSGLTDFLETVQGATASTKGAGKLLARTASSVVIPNLAKQIDKLFDPNVYEANSVTEALVRETPVARRNLRPMLNALGEPIEGSNNRFFSHGTGDPVWKLIVEKQAWVPIPSKTTKIKNRPIEPDEYYELIQRSGPRIRQYIEANRMRFETMDDEKVQDAIRDKTQEIRAQVKARFR